MCDGNACAQGSGMRRRAPAAQAPRAISSLASISRGRKAGDGEAAPQMAPARVMAAHECARQWSWRGSAAVVGSWNGLICDFLFYVRERRDTSLPTLSAAGVATLWLRSTARLVEPVDPLFLC